jgi:hypothetical protein
MTPEQQQAIQTHVEAISAILYADCEPESLKTLEDIELAVKERVLTHVTPHIGQYGSVKSYAVLKTINTGGFIIIPVPLCLTCLERNFETGFFTTLGLFL